MAVTCSKGKRRKVGGNDLDLGDSHEVSSGLGGSGLERSMVDRDGVSFLDRYFMVWKIILKLVLGHLMTQ